MQDLESGDEVKTDDDRPAATSQDASSSSSATADRRQQSSAPDAEDDRRARLLWRLEEIRVIKYGTLGRLVAALSDASGQMDVSNVNTFLTTCRTFASAGDVVNELIKRSVYSH